MKAIKNNFFKKSHVPKPFKVLKFVLLLKHEC